MSVLSVNIEIGKKEKRSKQSHKDTTMSNTYDYEIDKFNFDNLPSNVLNDIITAIDEIGKENGFKQLEKTESILLNTTLSHTWITVGAQSDASTDGKWAVIANIQVEYGTNDEEYAEIEINMPIGDNSITATKQAAYEALITNIAKR